MGRLLLLFIVVPAIELGLLIEVGSRIGTLATLGLIVATGIAGAALARRQGLGVIREMQAEVAEGRLPADSLVDGVFILVAAALLVTPGILTDAFGLLCLVPAFRGVAKGLLWRRLEHAVREQRIRMEVHFGEGERGERPVYEVRSTGGSEGDGSPRVREGPRRREHRLPKRR